MINMPMLEHVPDFHKNKQFAVIKGLTRPLRTPKFGLWDGLCIPDFYMQDIAEQKLDWHFKG